MTHIASTVRLRDTSTARPLFTETLVDATEAGSHQWPAWRREFLVVADGRWPAVASRTELHIDGVVGTLSWAECDLQRGVASHGVRWL